MTRTLRRTVRTVALLAMAVVLSALAARTGAAAPLVSPEADLAAGAVRSHPDTTLSLVGGKFNVYTGAAMPGEWALAASHTGTPGMGTMDVVVYSQAWRHTDGHLLFAYRIENRSTASVRSGNVKGFDPSICDVLDCGILDFGGDADFDQGDVLQLSRSGVSVPQLGFAFEGLNGGGQSVSRLLAPGETSSWFYVETTASSYGYASSTVQDSGQSADLMQVLVPVPEPATVGLLGLGLLGLAGRRRPAR